LRLINSGGWPLSVESAALSGSDVADFVVKDEECLGQVLEPGQSCDLELGFRPRRAGELGAELLLVSSWESGDQTLKVDLVGAGTAPKLEVSPGRLSFGGVRLTEGAERPLGIRNGGTAPLLLGRVALEGEERSDFSVAEGGCHIGQRLEPGEECRLTIVFRPTRERREISAALSIAMQNRSEGVTIELQGSALPPPAPQMSFSPRRLDFGPLAVGDRSPIATLTLSNSGSGPLALRGIELAAGSGEDFRLVPGSCEGLSYLLPGSECTVGVRFWPQYSGLRQGQIVLRHNAGRGETRVEMVGEAVGSGP
jgi:hypothetical protein